MSPVQFPTHSPSRPATVSDTTAEGLMATMLSATDLGQHGIKVAAGLTRFYKYTTPPAQELAAKAYPWLVDLFKALDDFDGHWKLNPGAPLIVPKDPLKPLGLHPAITSGYTDQFSGKTISGLQILLAVALTVNPDLDAAIKVAVQSGGPLPIHPRTVKMVTMPGARKSHSTGVYLLRFGTKVGAPTGAQTKHQGNVLIDTAITTTFKERLDVPLYSADERVVNAASWVDQRRDRDDFILFDLECYSDSIPQLDWITLGLKSLCVVMFATAMPGRGLNTGIVGPPPGTDVVARLKIMWEAVHAAVAGGSKVYPYKPDEAGPETFEGFYTAHLEGLDTRANIAACYELVRSMSLLADTGDFGGSFAPLPADAWASHRPVPRGLYGDATPAHPPTIGIYRHVHRTLSPARRRGRSPANAQRFPLPRASSAGPNKDAPAPGVTAKPPL